MTINELIHITVLYETAIIAFFCLLPIITLVIGWIHGRGRGFLSPWKYVYGFLIYLVSVPGILSAVLTGYTFFFTQINLLKVNVIVYFLPIISMIITLLIINKRVDFKRIPGFDRIQGLMLLIGVSFIIALIIQKMRIWVVFGGSIFSLFIIAVVIFLILKYALHLLSKRK